MYISRMLYLLLLSFLSPLLPSLPCCGLSHLVSPSKFKTYAWTCSLLPFPLLLSLSSSCNEAAAAVLLQRCCCNAVGVAASVLQHPCCSIRGSCNADAATQMLQRGCCNADAATLHAASSAASWSGLVIKLVAALLITHINRWGRITSSIELIIVRLKLNSWNAHLYSFMPTSSDSISRVQQVWNH